ncbi:hypothetical protein B0G76_8209 [Paraburkholderia sp. BL23I1N1]|uniref:hypothetical protein n=1 Tax=Paraburkholderia sp. BL23I1N1 TaxID=1938802 RepID=UPI000E707DDF|nr:hypothetical protein [Paraburkholderia sp. BL23I1N1]RKE24328.1 hypothetical protein B0G76_8209 [Paraburkholderia sp. BL23I1N1]
MVFDNEQLKLRERVSAGRQSDLYSLENDDTLLKMYRTSGNQTRLDRINRLISSGSSRLRARCAWPAGTFTFHDRDAVIVPFVAHQSTLAHLIPRAKRQASFPNLDWRGMMRFAEQLAQCVAAVHAENMLVGDLDLHNVLISMDNELILTRCDSFLLEGEAIDPADSAAALQWPPPELKTGQVESTARTIDHDNFTLARLIFELVFLNDEPTQKDVGDWAALFNGELSRGGRAHPTLHVTANMLSPGLVACFRQATDPSSTRSTPRPDAERWSRELAAMASSMRTCAVEKTHTYRSDMASGCPWCELALEAPGSAEFSGPQASSRPARPSAEAAAHTGATGNAAPMPSAQRGHTTGNQASSQRPPIPAQARKNRLFIAFVVAAAGALAVIVLRSSQHASAGSDAGTPDQRADAVISRWFDAINAPQGHPDDVIKLYAASAVTYRGQRNSQPNVFFPYLFNRWPERDYKPVPSTQTTTCDPQSPTCAVSVTVLFRVARPGATNHGCVTYQFTVNVASQPALISDENSSPAAPGACDALDGSSGASQ